MSVKHADEAHRGRIEYSNLTMDSAKGNQVELCRVVNAIDGLHLRLFLRVFLESFECVHSELGLLALCFLSLLSFFLSLDLLSRALLIFFGQCR